MYSKGKNIQHLNRGKNSTGASEKPQFKEIYICIKAKSCKTTQELLANLQLQENSEGYVNNKGRAQFRI